MVMKERGWTSLSRNTNEGINELGQRLMLNGSGEKDLKENEAQNIEKRTSKSQATIATLNISFSIFF